MADFEWFGKINKAAGHWVVALQTANPMSISTTSSLPPTIIGSGQRHSACKAKQGCKRPAKQPKRMITGSRPSCCASTRFGDQQGMGPNWKVSGRWGAMCSVGRYWTASGFHWKVGASWEAIYEEAPSTPPLIAAIRNPNVRRYGALTNICYC